MDEITRYRTTDLDLASAEDLMAPSTSSIMLANASGRHDEGLCGQLFDVRFSKSQRYRKDFVPSPRLETDADTWALYPCDEGKGAKLDDASGNGHHGNIVGGTWQAY